MVSLLYLPPARSRIYFLKSLFKCFNRDIDKRISQYIDGKPVVFGNSWVLLLSELLKKLKSKKKGDEVLLASHSCYEFTKSILIAGLKPVYVDVQDDFKMNINSLFEKVNNKTLAILSINNVGIENNNQTIKDYCLKNNIAFIEDATYTFLGTNSENEKFGSLGQYSVLNFSEGKIIPVGGGGIIINEDKYNISDDLFLSVNKKSRHFILEFLDIVKYILGSSTIGFSLYFIINKVLKINLKRAFSMETTRKSKDFKTYAQNTVLRDLGLLKKAVILTKLQNAKTEIAVRQKMFNKYLSFLKENNKKYFEYPKKGIILRVPLIIKDEYKDKSEKFSKVGIVKLYSEKSELYNKDSEFIYSNYFYEHLITAPVYNIGKKKLNRIFNLLDEIIK